MSRNSIEAVVEKMLLDIKDENTTSISQTLATKREDSDWWPILRFEIPIVPLMDGILDSDIILPRLVVCGIRTITPLHYAALRGADEILRKFKEKTHIPPDIPLSRGSTPLQFACFAGNLATVRFLLNEWKAELNKKDSYGWSPLYYASIGGHLEVVEELCKRGVDVVERDQDGTTAAYRAHIFGHEAVVKYFITIMKGNAKQLLEIKQDLKPAVTESQIESLYSKSSKQRQREEQPSNNVASTMNQKKQFLSENAYDFPDDLVTKVQCKYQPLPSVNEATYSNSTNTQKVVEREKSMIKVQNLVKSQLMEVFESDDTYLKPRDGTDVVYDVVGVNNGISNIGFNTLKYLLKSEFQKYKSGGQAVSHSNNNRTVNNNSEEHNIYDEIAKLAIGDKENKWIKGGQTIRCKFDSVPPPPLPRRNNVLNEEVFRSSQEQAPRSSFHKEFNRASVSLNSIEQTQVVREACFIELIPLLGPGDWQKLAKALPIRQNLFLTDEKIKNIEKQYPNDLKRQARAALQDWNKHFGKNATLESLMNAMKKCGFVEKMKVIEMANQKC